MIQIESNVIEAGGDHPREEDTITWVIFGANLPSLKIKANSFDEALRKARIRNKGYCGGYVIDEEVAQMKTFWAVNQKYFDSGAVKARIFKVEAEQKPDNGFVENKMCDEYIDYFDSYEEARKFYEDSKNA